MSPASCITKNQPKPQGPSMLRYAGIWALPFDCTASNPSLPANVALTSSTACCGADPVSRFNVHARPWFGWFLFGRSADRLVFVATSSVAQVQFRIHGFTAFTGAPCSLPRGVPAACAIGMLQVPAAGMFRTVAISGSNLIFVLTVGGL